MNYGLRPEMLSRNADQMKRNRIFADPNELFSTDTREDSPASPHLRSGSRAPFAQTDHCQSGHVCENGGCKVVHKAPDAF